jgi:hypothetical protein
MAGLTFTAPTTMDKSSTDQPSGPQSRAEKIAELFMPLLE